MKSSEHKQESVQPKTDNPGSRIIHSSLFTFKQFASRHPAFSEPALRNIRFKSTARLGSRGPIQSNGAEAVFFTVGRKVLIDEDAFFLWIARQNGGRNEQI